MIYLELSLVVLLGTSVSLTAFMTIYLIIRRRRRIKYTKWNHIADLLVRKAIFFERDETNIHSTVPLTHRAERLIINRRFRSHLTKKIISAARSLSGQSADNLKLLYLQLGLDKFALSMIGSSKWHKKAQGIQQLGVMGLKSHLTTIYRYTNHKNESIRIEAQLSVLKLYGFEGLRFLDVVSYRISEWQQILLLKELSLQSHSNLTGIEKWLQSENSSVVIFALKLARNYHHFELYDAIKECLKHPAEEVRVQAIYALTEVYTESTSALLTSLLPHETINIQLTLAKAIMKIGDSNDLEGLLRFFDNISNFSLKFAVARTIAHLEGGIQALQGHPEADNYPVNEMMAQIYSEIR